MWRISRRWWMSVACVPPVLALLAPSGAQAMDLGAGVAEGTLTYTGSPPPPLRCGATAWTLSATGGGGAASPVVLQSAGTVSLTVTGSSPCDSQGMGAGAATVAINSVTGVGTLSCFGPGNYLLVGAAIVIQAATNCSINAVSSSDEVRIVGVLAPTSTDGRQDAFAGAYIIQ